jgi:TolA-binding protein
VSGRAARELQPQAETRSKEERSEAQEAPAAPAPIPQTAPAARAMSDAADPERLLEQIAELRKQGRHEEADKALEDFRRRYPDYRIPESALKK